MRRCSFIVSEPYLLGHVKAGTYLRQKQQHSICCSQTARAAPARPLEEAFDFCKTTTLPIRKALAGDVHPWSGR